MDCEKNRLPSPVGQWLEGFADAFAKKFGVAADLAMMAFGNSGTAQTKTGRACATV